VQSVILASVDVLSRVPLETSLSRENVSSEDLSGVAPLLETESATCGISLVVSGTSHDLGGETHCWEVATHHECIGIGRVNQSCLLVCQLQHLRLAAYIKL